MAFLSQYYGREGHIAPEADHFKGELWVPLMREEQERFGNAKIGMTKVMFFDGDMENAAAGLRERLKNNLFYKTGPDKYSNFVEKHEIPMNI